VTSAAERAGRGVVDVHAHLYPTAFLEALRSGAGDGVVEVEESDTGWRLVVGKLPFVDLEPEFFDPKVRLAMMDASGVSTQVLSLPPPMVYWASPERALELCRIVNDSLAQLAADHPGRFVACCVVPLQAPELAAEELRRAIEQLGCRMVLFGSNILGTDLDDASLAPVYEEIERLDVPIFNHPIIRAGLPCLRDHRLDVSLGFTLETTFAASRMILGGVFDRHPGLRICWSHLGGGLPFLADRIGYLSRQGRECFPGIDGIARDPFASYLRHFWYDTVVYSERNLAFGMSFAGADRLMFGTDTPFFSDTTDFLLTMIRRSPLVSDEDEEAILQGNAIELLGLQAVPPVHTAPDVPA